MSIGRLVLDGETRRLTPGGSFVLSVVPVFGSVFSQVSVLLSRKDLPLGYV